VILACPSCGARFNLDPAKLLPAGRNVRCAKCDHRWRQMPEGFDEPAAEPETLAPPAEIPASIPEPAPQSEAESFAPPAPEEPESHPPSPPETAAEMAQSLAAIAEQVAGARGESYTVGEGARASNPIARMARRTGPGPITVPPRMRPMRPAKRSSHLGLILMAGFVIGLLVAGYVFRDVIARSVPGADVVYSMFGFSTDDPAADLEISNFVAKIKRDEQTGQNIIDLSATIFNLSSYPVNMPILMVIPIDDLGSQMEPMRFRLQELVIEPGQNINFTKSFDNWPASAPSAVLSVADVP
jgi:predicted Zn finger-like uncharacterized protein